ncbi:hypothetical protein D3C81_1083920 [compost metagenome]
MDIAPELSALSPQHHDHLGMRLETDDAIDDMRADFLQLRRPADVRLLVEAGQQFHHRGDLLAVARRLDECRQQDRVVPGPIHGLADRHDIGIPCRLPDEIDDRRK